MAGSENQKLAPFTLPENPLTQVANVVEKTPAVVAAAIGALYPIVTVKAFAEYGWHPPFAAALATASMASLTATAAVFAAAAATLPAAVASIHAPFNMWHVANWMKGSALGFADHAIATPIANSDMYSRHSWKGPASDVAVQDAITLQTLTNELKDSFRDVQSPLNGFAMQGMVLAAGFLVSIVAVVAKLITALGRVPAVPALATLPTIWVALKDATSAKGLIGWLLGDAAGIAATTLNTNFGLTQAYRVNHEIPAGLGHGREGQPNRRGEDPVVWNPAP